MADCSSEFSKFHNEIELSSSKKRDLRKSRDAIRKRIKKHFKETLKQTGPKFAGQGSYAMKTTVNPIDGEFDIDDGVYLQNLDDDKAKWPTAETAHKWIHDAVKDQTDEKTEDRAKCVRVAYKKDYHIDLPIYGMNNSKPFLAIKGERQWTESDPKALTDWFVGEVNKKSEQVRRCVRYAKAWRDKQNNKLKMPSGLVLTVLVVEKFHSDSRDDKSFHETMNDIKSSFSSRLVVWNPADRTEDLAAEMTDEQVKNFKEKLEALSSDGQLALNEDCQHKATKLWRKQFGDRFPLVDEEQEKSSSTHTEESIRKALTEGRLAVDLDTRRVDVVEPTDERAIKTRPWGDER